MKYAIASAPGEWLGIAPSGTLVLGGGESGEDVVLSEAFLDAMGEDWRAARGYVDVVETEPPEGATGFALEDVEGVPTMVWATP